MVYHTEIGKSKTLRYRLLITREIAITAKPYKIKTSDRSRLVQSEPRKSLNSGLSMWLNFTYNLSTFCPPAVQGDGEWVWVHHKFLLLLPLQGALCHTLLLLQCEVPPAGDGLPQLLRDSFPQAAALHRLLQPGMQ